MSGIQNLKINLNNKILQSDKVIIVPHIEADFDAIASSTGVSLISDKINKENHILIGDNIEKLDAGVQMMIDEVKAEHSIINLEEYEKMKTKDTLNVLCDVSKPVLSHVKTFDREKLAIIDHHDKDNGTFDAGLLYIDSSATSASEIMTNLLEANEIVIPKNVANMLVSGILLDTSDMHKNDPDATMDFIEEMKKKYGCTLKEARKYFIINYESDKKVHKLIGRARVYDDTFALTLGGEQEVYAKEELAKAADHILGYPVDSSFAIGNIGEGVISISARSKDILNAGRLMTELSAGCLYSGGGSHCSGATKLTNTTVQEVGKKLKSLLKEKYNLNKKKY